MHPAGSPSISAMRIPPEAAHPVIRSARAGSAENGSLPHWPVRPCAISHATALSNILRTA
nr:hypothetical protein GCM10020093_074520 [Planobispora longispora]